MLIYRVQLPEDAALNQARATVTLAPNPSTTPLTLGTGTTGDRTASQSQETTVPETQPPTVGGSGDPSAPTRPIFLRRLIDYMWSDPHSRICEL